MSIQTILLLAFLVIAAVIIVALNHKSKACTIDTSFNATGFKITFKTNEKSTPSNKDKC